MTSASRPFLLLASCFAAVLSPAVALADEPTAAEIAVARRLYRDAVSLEESGNWTEAEQKLREAIAIKETPGLRFHLAVAQEKQGKLVEALVDYDRADELVAKGTRAPDVEQLLGPAREKIKQRIPTLTLNVPASAQGAALAIDGKRFKPQLLGTPIPLNPGEHEVTVTAAGKKPFEAKVTLAEAERQELEVVLVSSEGPGTAAGSPGAGNMDTTFDATSDGDAPSGSSLRTGVLIGEAAFTVLALGAGIGFTVYKNNRQSQVDAAQSEVDKDANGTCDPRPTSSAGLHACDALDGFVDERDQARTFATIGFVAAGVGAIATVATFVFWQPSERPSTSVAVLPVAGGATIGFGGSF